MVIRDPTHSQVVAFTPHLAHLTKRMKAQVLNEGELGISPQIAHEVESISLPATPLENFHTTADDPFVQQEKTRRSAVVTSAIGVEFSASARIHSSLPKPQIHGRGPLRWPATARSCLVAAGAPLASSFLN